MFAEATCLQASQVARNLFSRELSTAPSRRLRQPQDDSVTLSESFSKKRACAEVPSVTLPGVTKDTSEHLAPRVIHRGVDRSETEGICSPAETMAVHHALARALEDHPETYHVRSAAGRDLGRLGRGAFIR